MLRKFLDFQLSLVEKGRPLHKLRPLITAGDTFFYEPPINTSKGPHVRDAVDAKRWMIMVVLALLPCCLMAVWNTGLQKMVYGSGDYLLMNEYLTASASFQDYMDFAFKDNRWLTILQLGAMGFLPILIITYAVGGLWEGLFACVRGHEIAEGFLVTGLLYPLILPATIPYWMVAVGISFGVVIGKELFGGSGMNIMNVALTSRAFLFFTFPNKMSGDVWVGTNPTAIRTSLQAMNQKAGLSALDGYSQATPLGLFNVADDIKRVHVDAIASNNDGIVVPTMNLLREQFTKWTSLGGEGVFGSLSSDQLHAFVTGSAEKGGLGLGLENYQAAYQFAGLQYGVDKFSDANFFFGNQLGCMGETSAFACILGALILVMVGVASWRVMAGVVIGAFATAAAFQFGANTIGGEEAIWNTARYAFPAYKHLIIGGIAFGLVFMATDPVSSPSMNSARWLYGLFIGMVVIVIRAINPAFPEGMMLAILLGNVFAPLFDYYAVRKYRRVRRVAVA